MSKRDKLVRARRRHKRQIQKQKHQTSRARKLIRWLGSPAGLFFWLPAILTIASTYYSFKSHVSVEMDAPKNAKELFPTAFKITNDSWLPIYHLKHFTGAHEISLSNNRGASNLTLDDLSPEIPKLEAKEATTVWVTTVPLDYRGAIQADITVEVAYKTLFVIPRSENFRFTSWRDERENVHWRHLAESEPVIREQ